MGETISWIEEELKRLRKLVCSSLQSNEKSADLLLFATLDCSVRPWCPFRSVNDEEEF